MSFYLNIENNKIISASNEPINKGRVQSISVTEEVYYNFIADGKRYEVKNNKIVEVEGYADKKAREREAGFKKQFFATSLGWIRREPTLADGTKDNFLNNNLPLLAIALTAGQQVVLPVAYRLPDFHNELTDDYMKTLQIENQPINQMFIAECLQVKMADFRGETEEVQFEEVELEEE